MPTIDLTPWLPLVVALAGGVGVELIRQWATHNKTGADTSAVVVASSGQVIGQWRDLYGSVQNELKEQRARTDSLEQQIAQNNAKISQLDECVDDLNAKVIRSQKVIAYLLQCVKPTVAQRARNMLTPDDLQVIDSFLQATQDDLS